MHPLSGALNLPYVPTSVTRGALIAHIIIIFYLKRSAVQGSVRVIYTLSV